MPRPVSSALVLPEPGLRPRPKYTPNLSSASETWITGCSGARQVSHSAKHRRRANFCVTGSHKFAGDRWLGVWAVPQVAVARRLCQVSCCAVSSLQVVDRVWSLTRCCAAADPPRQRPAPRQPAPPAEHNEIRFTYTELAGGTANFTPSLVLGEGGFGKCYKGHVRHQEVAIKLLDRLGQQVSTEPWLAAPASSQLCVDFPRQTYASLWDLTSLCQF